MSCCLVFLVVSQRKTRID